MAEDTKDSDAERVNDDGNQLRLDELLGELAEIVSKEPRQEAARFCLEQEASARHQLECALVQQRIAALIRQLTICKCTIQERLAETLGKLFTKQLVQHQDSSLCDLLIARALVRAKKTYLEFSRAEWSELLELIGAYGGFNRELRCQAEWLLSRSEEQAPSLAYELNLWKQIVEETGQQQADLRSLDAKLNEAFGYISTIESDDDDTLEVIASMDSVRSWIFEEEIEDDNKLHKDSLDRELTSIIRKVKEVGLKASPASLEKIEAKRDELLVKFGRLAGEDTYSQTNDEQEQVGSDCSSSGSDDSELDDS